MRSITKKAQMEAALAKLEKRDSKFRKKRII